MPLPYHAGKTRLAPHISNIIFKKIKKNPSIKKYAEPFSGMMRVGIKVMEDDKDKIFKKYMFSDVNDTIAVFFKALKRGWLPNTNVPTQQQWVAYKKSKAVSAQKITVGTMSLFCKILASGGQRSWLSRIKRDGLSASSPGRRHVISGLSALIVPMPVKIASDLLRNR